MLIKITLLNKIQTYILQFRGILGVLIFKKKRSYSMLEFNISLNSVFLVCVKLKLYADKNQSFQLSLYVVWLIIKNNNSKGLIY